MGHGKKPSGVNYIINTRNIITLPVIKQRSVPNYAECLTLRLCLAAEPVAVNLGLPVIAVTLKQCTAYCRLKKRDGIIQKGIGQLPLKVAAWNESE